MISYDKGSFRLTTKRTSYIFGVTAFGHLEHLYYGKRIPEDQETELFQIKRTAFIGTSVAYDEKDPMYCLDNMCLEWSGIGKGDYRETPAELKMPDGSFTTDFVYKSHEIFAGSVEMKNLPSAYAGAEESQTLRLVLQDESTQVTLCLYYCIYEKTDVITRRAVLFNENERPLTIRKLMSFCLDMPNREYRLLTLDGGWIKEAHRHQRRVNYGIYVNSSTTGASSNRHNPGVILARADATEDAGSVYAFNLVYSGNHYTAVELSNHDILRIVAGIHPQCFEWKLEKGENFETPEAVMSYSEEGYNGLSANLHEFVNTHIVRGEWQKKERPVLLNNWEAHFFDFTRGKLLRLAKQAKKAGIEMFVLDDGWFAGRNSDTAGLGDYLINRKKLPRGLAEFSKQIHKMGLKFGLWCEPEMVNQDSNLYREHPEYAVVTPGKVPALGRNQLVLDLGNPAVQDYIVEHLSSILDEAQVDYVKWDFNRHLSDLYSPLLQHQGEFCHRYILGLYRVLSRIFEARPHILLESCASGGNRFDLGMLCYSPQIWASDDTDPMERLKIQGGLSYLYPLSCMGAHVSEAPHQQTLRETPLGTRFHVASFGCLGYEMDFKYLSYVQKQEIKEQIAFYKQYRSVFQYGRFYRNECPKDNKYIWHCVSKNQDIGVTGLFQTMATASEGIDILELKGLKEQEKYCTYTKRQRVFIRRFGGLVKHILPVTLNPEGMILRFANRWYALKDCVEYYEGYGAVLKEGILLNNQFMGSYYNSHTRLLGDFGSNIYVTEVLEQKGGKTNEEK